MTQQPPPTPDDLLALWRRVTPQWFWGPMEGQESEAVFRALAAQFGTVAEQLDRSTQGRFFLPYATQRGLPASYGLRATADITIARTAYQDRWVVVPTGMVQLGALSRAYSSVGAQIWWPGDTADREIPVACEVEGYVGNLGFAAGPDGSLPPDLMGLVDQTRRRSGDNASLVPVTGDVALQDSGIPDVLDPADVGLYVQITGSTFPANVGEIRQITGFVGASTEIPPGSGLYPRTVLLESSVWRSAAEVLLWDATAATYTDYTAEAISPGPPDVPVFGPTPAVGDALYFGQLAQFGGLVVDLGILGDGSWTIAWEYWDGIAWQPFPDLGDLTLGWLGNSGVVEVSWTVPVDWFDRPSPVSGLVWWFARARLAALTSVVTTPTVTRLVTRSHAPLLADAGGITWRLLSWADMGLDLAGAMAPAGGRDNDLWLLGDERWVYPQPGEAQEVFRQRASRLADVVSPAAINRAVNRALAPLGLQGKAVDVGSIDTNGDLILPGLWLDIPTSSLPFVSALDLYSPGDLYPVNPWHLLLSADDAYGWFFVLVPWGSTGDFGAFLDVGMSYLTDYGDAAAMDSAFFDGWPVTYYGAVAALYDTVSTIKAGGVGFTLVRTEDP